MWSTAAEALGRFIPGRTWVHALDPRTKLLCTALLMGAVFGVSDAAEAILLAGFALLAIVLAGVRWRQFNQALLSVSILMCVSFLLQMWFTPGDVLLQWGPISFTRAGLYQGSVVAFRLALLASLSALLGFTTDSGALANGLEGLLRPLRLLGLRTQTAGLVLGLGLRFVPLILEQAQQIVRAQRARGIDFREGSLIRRARRLLSVFIPLFDACLRRALELAMAMEARGYRIGATRSGCRSHPYRGADWLALVVVCALVCFILW